MMEENLTPGILTAKEIALAGECLRTALEEGASKGRVTLNKSMMDQLDLLNGELDKVSHCGDISITLNLFVDGRYGTFSSNRLDEVALMDFTRRAVQTTRVFAPDRYRDLPSADRTAKDARTGRELGLFDEEYLKMTSQRRLQTALESSIFKKEKEKESLEKPPEYKLISEEGEYSDSVFDDYVIDSNGLECRHTETSFEIYFDQSIEDSEGNKITGSWWDGTPLFKDTDFHSCSKTALQKAIAQIGPEKVRSGKYTMVVDSEVSSKLVNPILNALNGFSIQQKNSFLTDSLGKKIFAEGVNIMDVPRRAGESGSRLFDSEGVATQDGPIVERGVLKRYFLNTYTSNMLGMAPTIEDCTRVQVLPYLGAGHNVEADKKSECIGTDYIISRIKKGILVTGFNGGNSNSSTGDFSYGIEGFLFSDGKLLHPVREMVISGNFLKLWSHLVVAGNDARVCKSNLVPTLAFEDVDFSA